MSNSLALRTAEESDIQEIVPLFMGYRDFYKQPISNEDADDFLRARYTKKESVVCIATWENKIVAFTQCYPTFCSLLAKPIYVLYDLFVAEGYRQKGIARSLMEFTEQIGKRDGKYELQLSTDHGNKKAQALYDSMGWVRINNFQYYFKKIGE